MTEDTAMAAGAGPSTCAPVTAEAPAATEDTAASEATAETTGDTAMTEDTAMTADTAMTEDTGAAAPAGPFVQVVMTDLFGEIIVDSECRTLYAFTQDSEGESTCFEGCATAWPPLFVPDETVPPVADELDPAMFSVVDHPDGPMLKFGDWPLYYFASDVEPGDMFGQGVNGVWWVIAPDGTLIEAAADGTEAADGTMAEMADDTAMDEAVDTTVAG